MRQLIGIRDSDGARLILTRVEGNERWGHIERPGKKRSREERIAQILAMSPYWRKPTFSESRAAV